MKVLRLLGLLLLAASVVSVGYDIIATFTGSVGGLMMSVGEQWGKLNPASLNLVQAIVQRYLHPALWDPLLVNILLLPAWLVFGAPGLLLYLLGREREFKDRVA